MSQKRSQRKPAPQPKRGGRKGSWPLWLGAILAVTFLSYLPSLSNGFINWDDNFYVTENEVLKSGDLRGLLTMNVAANYHPLTMASLALNYKLSGLDASSYHWLNLLLHLANTALVFFFVRALTGGRLWTSVVTALFMGIHPTHVESVAWISERKDVLYAFFYLIALLAYVRYLDGRRFLWLAAAFVAFVLSCASKPAAVVLPVTLLAIDWFRRRPWDTRALVEKAPFFLVSLAVGVLTFSIQKSEGAVAGTTLWNPGQRILFASLGTVLYFVRCLVPARLSAVYPLPNTTATGIGPEYYAAPVILIALLATIVVAFRRARPVLFGLAFFFINIILVIQVVTVGAALMADRYTYVPYIGLFFALSWWLDEPQLRGWFPVKRFLAGVFLVLAVFSAVETWKRCQVWKDPEVFWNDAIGKYPRRIVDAYYNRGNYRSRQGRNDEALADYSQALLLNDKIPRIWYNRGLIFVGKGQNDSAEVDFDHVLKLTPTNVDALNNRGAMKYRRGDFAGAVADFSRAIEINPRYRDAWLNRSLVLVDMKQYERAVEDRKRGIEVDPRNPNLDLELGALGKLLQQLNRHQEAIDALNRAIAAAAGKNDKLGEYYLGRSYSWVGLHDRARALADVREAQRLGAKVDPGYVRSLGG